MSMSLARCMPRAAMLRPLSLIAGLYVGATAIPGRAEASVVGRNGIEIEGPQDRRGFFIGAGIGFGAVFFNSPVLKDTYKDTSNVIPAGRLELSLGGGVNKRVTLGANLYLGMYTGKNLGTKPLMGGDVEGYFFVVKGLFIRTGLGAAGVPGGDGKIKFGVGGLLGLGYEFWLNQSAALAVNVNYDLRAVPGDGMRHTPYLGLRFAWY
ncbi:MAG: hypothetical protein IPO88_30305 [Nannocystis sp.]|uniref:hypothetical protein n=2 Tax=Nannocystis sp. TaxID=1962667 RepID=UPI0024217DEE|nr:hypothetical protein [Nannocystis sp.]MBK9757725.1 hypothetical protein [Nannocystis sp.]